MGISSKLGRRAAIAFVGIAMLVALAPAAAPHINNNFHTVVEGQVYRSAQPSSDEIRQYVRLYKIAAIINLRGRSPGARWYDDEIRTSKDLGINHIDFAMSARRQLTPLQTLQLIDLMQEAPKPLLIHCQAGADRTGLASSLYIAAIARGDERDAESQLSLRYGHYSMPVVGTREMDLTWEAFEPYLGFGNS